MNNAPKGGILYKDILEIRMIDYNPHNKIQALSITFLEHRTITFPKTKNERNRNPIWVENFSAEKLQDSKEDPISERLVTWIFSTENSLARNQIERLKELV